MQKNLMSLSGIAIILVVIFAVMLLFPKTTVIKKNVSDARIQFSASREWVWEEDGCVTLAWDVDSINGVYINGEGHSGQGEENFCRNSRNDTATILIEFTDGTSETYDISIKTIWQTSFFWTFIILLGVTILTMLFVLLRSLWNQSSPKVRGVIQTGLKITQILVINVLVIFILLEFGLRFYFGNFGDEQQRAMYIYSLDELRQNSNVGKLPFLNYGLSGSDANNLGFRDPEDIELPKPEGQYRIVALGGSTTFGLLVSASQAYPAQLQYILRDDYGYSNVDVINAGVIGYDSWNSVVNLIFRVLEVEPDMIIIYHATNDMHPREQLLPDCYRGSNEHRGLNAEAATLQLDGQFISPSALQRFVFINLSWMDNPLAVDSSFEQTIPCYYESLESDMPASERVANNPPLFFERNMRTLIQVAEANGIDVMLSTWTYDAAIQAPYGEAYWIDGIAEHNEIISRLALEYDTLFFDLVASDLSENSDYWFDDYTHQSQVGHQRQATLYAEYLANLAILANR